MLVLDDHNHQLRSSPQPTTMDDEGFSSPDLGGKKRKREEQTEGGGTIADSLHALSNYYAQHPFTPAPSSPSTFTDLPQFDSLSTSVAPQNNLVGPKFEAHLSKRVHLSPKSRRPPTPASQLSHEYFSPSVSQYGFTKPATSACHICHRRPTTTSDIAAYVDCELCHERTCFICLRTCEAEPCQSANPKENFHSGLGISGRNVCGKCCVEVGVDGRVWCLGCYEDESIPAYKIGPTKKELQVDNVGRIAEWLGGVGYEQDSTD